MLGRLAALFPIGRYEVEGSSMAPAFVAGERLLINRAAYWFAEPRPGDVVVVRDPRVPDRLLLKRVTGEADGAWRVEGDSADESTDSRDFGAVPKQMIIGRFWRRY